jgi:hypothetical protein
VGETDEEAQGAALENAWKFLNRYGEPPDPNRWLGLSLQEVREQFVAGMKEKVNPEVIPGRLKTWAVTVEVTPAQHEELLRLARSHERMALWAKLVVLAVLTVAAVGGYLRLEEWAHWRHTFLPRLAGAGVLGAVAAGAWWLL